MPHKIPKEILTAIETVKNKRARFVLDRIVTQGYVTTEEIRAAGYTHEPRAARDVRELGFPLQTAKTLHSNGRTIASYSIPSDGKMNLRKRGRQLLGKKQWAELLLESRSECAICRGTTDLQADHRVPYEVGGEPADDDLSHFQVLCGSCNRKKSWSCESCANWRVEKDSAVCKRCYWGSPDLYVHIATKPVRRVDLEWVGDETKIHDQIVRNAEREGLSVASFIKKKMKQVVSSK